MPFTISAVIGFIFRRSRCAQRSCGGKLNKPAARRKSSAWSTGRWRSWHTPASISLRPRYKARVIPMAVATSAVVGARRSLAT